MRRNITVIRRYRSWKEKTNDNMKVWVISKKSRVISIVGWNNNVNSDNSIVLIVILFKGISGIHTVVNTVVNSMDNVIMI